MNDEPVAYDVAFEWEESHGHVVELLMARQERGLLVDIGCGYAPHAETLRDAGFTFVGLDLNPVAVEALTARGFDARVLDLGDRRGAMRQLATVTAEHLTPLVGVLALDVIEHLVEPHQMLAALSEWIRPHDAAVLAVSVPNVAHRDVAAKLLAGRWDITPTGLLDQTHVRFFTDASLTAIVESAGFGEVARNDRRAPRSDQYWPAGAPMMASTARLASTLHGLRERIDDFGDVYQFIRLYEATPAQAGAPTLLAATPDLPEVFLSVVADPAMTEAEIERLQGQLGVQTNASWELLVPGEVEDGFARSAMFEALFDSATGAYLSIVGPDDVVSPDWVAQFVASGIDEHDELVGTILRCDAVPGDELSEPCAALAELGSLEASSATFAIPIDTIRMLGLGVGDNALPPSVELVIGAVFWAGVQDTGVVAVDAWSPMVVDTELVDAQLAVVDSRPALLPAGTLARIEELDRARRVAEDRIAVLEGEVARLAQDNTWLNGELGAAPVRAMRRALRRPGSSS